MDTLICNKCFVPIYRGKQPYNITQCAHIFCQDCLQQAQKQCSQCGSNGAMSIPLKEPMMPKVVPYFAPLAETLELLLKIDTFRSNQLKITMQRFRDLDKKYEIAKHQFWVTRQSMKGLMEKYTVLKSEKKKLEKKLMLAAMHRDLPSTSVMKTPVDSGIFTHPSSSGFSSESMELLRSSNITPMQLVGARKQYKPNDGFRIPSNHKPPKSSGSVNTPNFM